MIFFSGATTDERVLVDTTFLRTLDTTVTLSTQDVATTDEHVLVETTFLRTLETTVHTTLSTTAVASSSDDRVVVKTSGRSDHITPPTSNARDLTMFFSGTTEHHTTTTLSLIHI